MSKTWQADWLSVKELPQHLLYNSNKVQILKLEAEIPEQRLPEIRQKYEIGSLAWSGPNHMCKINPSAKKVDEFERFGHQSEAVSQHMDQDW